MSSRPAPLRRSLGRTAVAAATALGLVLTVSACEVRPGAAAFVGDDKIAESDVAGYVNATATASPSSQQGALTPRAQVVAVLVASRLFRDYLARDGGVPSDAELAASSDAAFSTITGQASPDIAQFRTQIESLGFDRAFADVYVEQIELEYTVIERSKAASITDLSKAVRAVTPTPKISPRYGTWDPSQLTLSGASRTPGYLTLTGTTGA